MLLQELLRGSKGNLVWSPVRFHTILTGSGRPSLFAPELLGDLMLLLILTIVLIIALVGSLPKWPHSRNWGYYPTGGVGLILVVLLVLYLMGVL
jgi:hypothetical protein